MHPSLGFSAKDPIEASDLVRKGLPHQKVEIFRKESGMSLERIASATHIARRTLARRKQGRLTGEESERLSRMASIFEQAVDLCEGDKGKAVAWMSRPNKALGGRTPEELAHTEIGGREVLSLLGRLEHGVFS